MDFLFEMFGKHTTASLQDLAGDAGFHGTSRSVATGSNRSDVSSISHHSGSERLSRTALQADSDQV